mgnify:CR=1
MESTPFDDDPSSPKVIYPEDSVSAESEPIIRWWFYWQIENERQRKKWNNHCQPDGFSYQN